MGNAYLARTGDGLADGVAGGAVVGATVTGTVGGSDGEAVPIGGTTSRVHAATSSSATGNHLTRASLGGQPSGVAGSSLRGEVHVRDTAGFDAFVAAQSPSLLRLGWLLTGTREAGDGARSRNEMPVGQPPLTPF